MPEYVARQRVAWVETDAGGRIHFTAVFRWAEAAEFELRRQLGLNVHAADFPRRHVEADYHRVLRFDDEFEIRLRPERVGHSSITYVWQISRDGEVYVDGRHVVVHVDAEGRAAPLPDAVREALGR